MATSTGVLMTHSENLAKQMQRRIKIAGGVLRDVA